MSKKQSNQGKLKVSQWVDEHLPILYGYALKRVRDPETAEELVQETFLAALKNFEKFAERSSERTWLIGILRHKILDHYRQRSKSPQVDLEEDGKTFFSSSGHWARKPSEWSCDPSALAENQEFWGVFETCLGHLPQSLSQAFVLREMEQHKAAKVCESLSISESNLWIRLHRARLRLRECLENNWFEGAGS
jgi:RNA polymerase sigma-70 factor (ECF subfamily)